jgi:hypothetical protein
VSKKGRPAKLRPDPYPQMDLAQAVKECGPYKELLAVSSKCPPCKQPIVLHCSKCNIQVTGCHCTRKARAQQERLEQANRLWVPGQQ